MESKQQFAERTTESGLHVVTKNLMEQTLDEAFPEVSPRCHPLGNRVLVQLRSPKTKVGNIVLTQETQDQEKFITTVAKVIELGSIAYHRRDDGEPWPEGVWVKVGDFVRVPKFGGDRWDFPVEETAGSGQKPERVARFAIYNDYDIYSLIDGDPLKFRDYV